MAGIYGRIVHGGMVEDAMLATLKAFTPDYMGGMADEIQRVTGTRPTLPPPRSYDIVETFDEWPAAKLPAVVVVSPGLAGPPVREGAYRATWRLEVAVVTSAATRKQTRRLAQIYTATLGTLLVQQGDLGGLAAGVDWVDEGYDDVPDDTTGRLLAAGLSAFDVDIRDVRDPADGPSAPGQPVGPDGNWPTFQSSVLTVEPKED